MHRLGLKIAMITGDNKVTAQAVARQLGIDTVVAEVLPAGKLEEIRKLRASDGAIAFVGDGINDAPALAEADIGIAVGTGTDVAIESAEVVLVSGDLTIVATALAISRATMRNIERFLEDTQQTVSGTVFCTLHPYRFTLDGIESSHDLMNTRFGSYGEMNTGWSGEDVRGFAKIFGNQIAIYHKINDLGHE